MPELAVPAEGFAPEWARGACATRGILQCSACVGAAACRDAEERGCSGVMKQSQDPWRPMVAGGTAVAPGVQRSK